MIAPKNIVADVFTSYVEYSHKATERLHSRQPMIDDHAAMLSEYRKLTLRASSGFHINACIRL